MPVNAKTAYAQMRRTLRRQHELLASLFVGAIDAHGNAERLGRHITAPLTGRTGNLGNVVAGERLLRIDAYQSATEVRNIYAGAVIDVLDFSLADLVQVAGACHINIFGDVDPKVSGHPVWRILRAGRNNHHHWASWRDASPPSAAQRYDIMALCALLGIEASDPLEQSPIVTDVVLEVLQTLAPSYDDLNMLVREQAADIVRRLAVEEEAAVVFAAEENGGFP